MVGYIHLTATTEVFTFSIMALQTEAQWKQFFHSAKITDDTVTTNYAKIFMDNEFTELSLDGLDKETLNEIGITVVGHRLSILQCVKKRQQPVASSTTPVSISNS